MNTPVRPYTAGLAAASASILTLSLVTAAPPETQEAVPRAETRVVQLATVTESDIRTAVVSAVTAFTSMSASSNATTPVAVTGQSAVSGVQPGGGTASTATADPAEIAPTDPAIIEIDPSANPVDAIATIASAALNLLIAPVWYLAAPITVPLYFEFLDQTEPCMYCPPFSIYALAYLNQRITGYLGYPFRLVEDVINGVRNLLGVGSTGQANSTLSTESLQAAPSARTEAVPSTTHDDVPTSAKSAQSAVDGTGVEAFDAADVEPAEPDVDGQTEPADEVSTISSEPAEGAAEMVEDRPTTDQTSDSYADPTSGDEHASDAGGNTGSDSRTAAFGAEDTAAKRVEASADRAAAKAQSAQYKSDKAGEKAHRPASSAANDKDESTTNSRSDDGASKANDSAGD